MKWLLNGSMLRWAMGADVDVAAALIELWGSVHEASLPSGRMCWGPTFWLLIPFLWDDCSLS